MFEVTPELKTAKHVIENKFLGKGTIHTVYIGEVERDGVPTGEIGIVALVDDKIPVAQIAAEEILPSKITIQGQDIRVDVQPSPPPTDLRLYVNSVFSSYSSDLYETQNWQSCHNCPLPGGVQIAPEFAGWVGTLACAVKFRNADGRKVVGALTNYHVAVSKTQRGVRIGQPNGSRGDWFAKLDRWSNIRFSTNANNHTDAALMDTWRDDGKYAPGVHTVKPEQYKIGKINPNPVLEYKIGDKVQKSGRTTGHQFGRVTGVGATTHVSYSQGTARFIDQIIIRGNSGLFSNSGDSGSLVLTEGDNRPYGLLFAGGGQNTIINPIKHVISEFDVEFFA